MKRIQVFVIGFVIAIALFCICYKTDNFAYIIIKLRGEKSEKVAIPEIFQIKLGRPHRKEDFSDFRISSQRQWIVNLTKSDYMKNVKKKKILVPLPWLGGFNLDTQVRNFACDNETVSMSEFCEITVDKWYNPSYSNYDEFDAVLVKRDWAYQFYEPRVPISKKRVLVMFESPYTVPQGDFSVNNPILASYWRGGDIVAPYYLWEPFEGVQEQKPSPSKNYAAGKTKLAAIVVSHCPTENDRLGFVEELQKYIPVDVFGSCSPGGNRCPSNCFEMISNTYKFYLAFENANCRDYITEKFFVNALQHDIIPVSYGAHPDDYKAVAPANSYIHVEDFKSPKELADYIWILDQNDTLYNEYFRWKGSGNIKIGDLDLFCRICAFLFYTDFHPTRNWPKDSRWMNVNPCLPPKQYYWNNPKFKISP